VEPITGQKQDGGDVGDPRHAPPRGLIAMLFADIEGSTRLAASLGDEWAAVLGAYHELVISAVRRAGGWVDGTAGDGFFITFENVPAAGRAAVAIQRALRAGPWPDAVGELKVRMGLHVGHIERQAHGYVGLEIHRAARVSAAAHGGQLLLTGVAAELLSQVVPSQPLGAHRLKDFPAPIALYCAVIDGRGAATFPAPRTLEVRAGNLPATTIGLVGREADLERVREALRGKSDRLVTLLGRGGVGKTSVALAAAHDVFEEYPGGVWWIDASGERDVAGVLAVIARECRVDAGGSTREAVIADLGSRGPLLLVVDNLEQITGGGGLLESLLAGLPELRVLATSQLPLRCPSERQLQLDRLPEAEAIALLARTAQRLDIRLADDQGAAELVQILDGLPLAIDLAAGRLRLFTPKELVARLRDSPGVLQDRTRPDRQRSLTAALDWTLELLDREARELFARLGVFAAPVALEDIEAVLGVDGRDVVSAAATLLDAALLNRVETGDGVVRLGLPEAVRQEAVRRLDAHRSQEWGRAHAVWQRDMIWPLRIFEFEESRLVERAHAAAAETRSALAWAWDHDRQLAREIALGRYSLAHRAGATHEARDLLNRVLADPGEDPRVVDLAREHEAMGHSDLPETHDIAAGLIELFPALRDLYARCLAAHNIGIALSWQERFDEALAWTERARQLAGEISPLAEASVLVVKADTLLEAGRPRDAETVMRESDAIAGSLRSPIRDTELVRAALESVLGNHVEALDRHGRALTHAELVGDQGAIQMLAISLVRAFARAGRERDMLEAAGVAKALAAERSAHGEFVSAAFAEPEPAVTTAIERLGPPAESIFDAGRSLEPSQRVKRLCALIYAE
jgi:class 3 adenylate cyclase/predicted ATPase